MFLTTVERYITTMNLEIYALYEFAKESEEHLIVYMVEWDLHRKS